MILDDHVTRTTQYVARNSGNSEIITETSLLGFPQSQAYTYNGGGTKCSASLQRK